MRIKTKHKVTPTLTKEELFIKELTLKDPERTKRNIWRWPTWENH